MIKLPAVVGFLVLTAAIHARAAECEGFAENQWWSIKGGVAVIGDGLYVDVRAKTNGLIIENRDRKSPLDPPDMRWTGKDSSEPEVVVIFERKALAQSSLPKDFDLSKAIIVSFEPGRVRIVDFVERRSGWYIRGKE